jgi:hypothetical protein
MNSRRFGVRALARREELRDSGIIVNGIYLSCPEEVKMFRGFSAGLGH